MIIVAICTVTIIIIIIVIVIVILILILIVIIKMIIIIIMLIIIISKQMIYQSSGSAVLAVQTGSAGNTRSCANTGANSCTRRVLRRWRGHPTASARGTTR